MQRQNSAELQHQTSILLSIKNADIGTVYHSGKTKLREPMEIEPMAATKYSVPITNKSSHSQTFQVGFFDALDWDRCGSSNILEIQRREREWCLI